jgi:hypothetical protein
LIVIVVWACQKPAEEKTEILGNPHAEGFNFDGSDPAAVELADSIMKAMGGRSNWEATRFISWNFGRRDLVWDKATGRVRIESPGDSIIYLVNVQTGDGRVQIKGQELMEADSLATMVDRAKRIWINDSYWLVMPYKLKDSGVTLTYLGEEKNSKGDKCNVLELTFNDVGVTPENKYQVYVGINDNLINEWRYFQKAAQDSASAIWPFDNYKKYGSILLSADRSDNRGPKEVKVDTALPDAIFSEF